MIKAAAFVGVVPVFGAVGPPRIEQTLREILTGDVDPFACVLRLREGFDFDGGVGDDFEEFLVVPDVVFAGGDVEDRPRGSIFEGLRHGTRRASR